MLMDRRRYITLSIFLSVDSSIQAGLPPGDEPLDGISGLIQLGANLNLRSVKGETSLDVARSYGAERVQRARWKREPDGCFEAKRFVRCAVASGEVLLTSSQCRV